MLLKAEAKSAASWGPCRGRAASGAADFHTSSTLAVVVALGVGLPGRFLEGIGDGVLEAQSAALARGGIPCVAPVACAGGLEECRFESRLDRILGCVIAVCVSGADECRGALAVPVQHG